MTTLNPPDKPKQTYSSPAKAWAHDPPPENPAFGLVNLQIRAIRLPTNRGTRVGELASPSDRSSGEILKEQLTLRHS